MQNKFQAMRFPTYLFLLVYFLFIHCKKDVSAPGTLIQGSWKCTTMTIQLGDYEANLPLALDNIVLKNGQYEFGPAANRQKGSYVLAENQVDFTVSDGQSPSRQFKIRQLEANAMTLEMLRQKGDQALLTEEGLYGLTALNLDLLRLGQELDETKILTSELVITLLFTKS